MCLQETILLNTKKGMLVTFLKKKPALPKTYLKVFKRSISKNPESKKSILSILQKKNVRNVFGKRISPNLKPKTYLQEDLRIPSPGSHSYKKRKRKER